MITISSMIVDGQTAKEIGISEEEYVERKKLITEFLEENKWDSAAHTLWLLSKGDIAIVGGQYPDSHMWKKQDMPPALVQAEGLLRDTGKIISSGVRFAEDSVYESRISICSQCDHMIKSRCAKCGCYMKIKAKFAVMKCPIGLWAESEAI